MAEDDLPPETKALIAKLRDDMKSKTVATRVTAYKSMGELGEKAKTQRRALCEGLLDANAMVRAAAADALKKVDVPLHKLALGIIIDRDRKDVVAAGKLGTEGEPLAPIILAYTASLIPLASSPKLASENENARDTVQLCVHALVSIAPQDTGVNQAIITLLANPSPVLRRAALDCVPPLKNKKLALKNVLAIAGATGEMLRDRLRAVELIPTLVDENTGPMAKKALETLRFDKEEKVREAVVKAIDNIR